MSLERPRPADVLNSERLANSGRAYPLDTSPDPAFDRLMGMARRTLSVPCVFAYLPTDQATCLKGLTGLPHSLISLCSSPVIETLGRNLLSLDKPITASDVTQNAATNGTANAVNQSIGAYSGVPVKTSKGQVIGAVCAFDLAPREWNDDDIAVLNDFAALVLTEIDLRAARQHAAADASMRDETNRLFQKINDAAPRLIYVASLQERRTVYANRGVTDLLGYPLDQFLTEGSDLLNRIIHPEDRPALMAHVERLHTLSDEEILEVECRMRHLLGEWRWLRLRDTVLTRNVDGAIDHVLGLAEDVTELKQAEDALRGLTDKLKRSNQTLQDFASVASHDLQEPLRKILQFGSRLQTRQQDDLAPEARDYLERMLRAADRMQGLLGDLLTYSRVTSRAQPFRAIDLNELVNGVISEIGMQRRRTGRIRILSELPMIEGDVAQLRQLFSHLLDNCLKFRQEDVPLEVEIDASITSVFGAECCKLTIQDNGIGFEARFAERIFEVFERLNDRDRYPGTGIGLAICRRIVERHGGSIYAEGVPHEGACFTVILPLRQLDTPTLMSPNASNGRIITPTRETQDRLPVFAATPKRAGDSSVVVKPGVESENK